MKISEILILYFVMGTFLWFGGLAKGDTAMQAQGLSTGAGWLSYANGSVNTNDSIGIGIMGQNSSSVRSSSFLMGFDIISLIWNGMVMIYSIGTAPLTFLISTGLPSELVYLLGGVLFIMFITGILEFWKGNEL